MLPSRVYITQSNGVSAFTPVPVHPQASARAPADPPLVVKTLGLVEYDPTWRAMQAFTAARTADTIDEIWLVQHPPVYTLGVAGRAAHLPRGRDDIPVVRSDRGGQITYHGPGQVVAYLLLDMKRRGLTVRPLVRLMEAAVIDSLAEYGITAAGRAEAPGVYVADAKIAALGLRVTRGCCYHGLALNVDMDLSPFNAIDPCGYPGLTVTQLRDLGVTESPQRVAEHVARHLTRLLA
ncbi:MAG: Octanoyltransferase [Betaproteobacteria bacterium]|nr:Octanoyltransferase [Betaproteobacteria bacterium]